MAPRSSRGLRAAALSTTSTAHNDSRAASHGCPLHHAGTDKGAHKHVPSLARSFVRAFFRFLFALCELARLPSLCRLELRKGLSTS